jgi:hypothetical protein
MKKVGRVAKNNDKFHANKCETCLIPFLYNQLYLKFKERAEKNLKGEKISFAKARFIAGFYFRIKKENFFDILKEMEKFDLIRIVPYHHILLLNGDKNGR